MNPGLAQGFVRFGTNHHRVLKALLELGELRHRDLIDDLGFEPRRASVALAQLSRNGFIHRQPYAPNHVTGERTQAVWGLVPYAGRRPTLTVRRTSAERTAVYRSRKKARAPSVFAYRP